MRSLKVDITKGLLVIIMVLAHCIQLLGDGKSQLLKIFLKIAFLGTFSGFVFCFGQAYWLAYLSKQKFPLERVIRTSIKCYLAYVISGLCFFLLVLNRKLNFLFLINLLLVKELAGYSEFLLSFCFLTIFAAIFRQQIVFYTERLPLMIIPVAVCLLSTFVLLPESSYALLAQIFAVKGMNCYPIISYFPLFLIGVFVARHEVKYNLILCCFFMLIVLLIFLFGAPSVIKQRFPPSYAWIICSFVIFYLFYGAASLIEKKFPVYIKSLLAFLGQNVLACFLISNISIFIICSLGWSSSFKTSALIAFDLILMIFIYGSIKSIKLIPLLK